MNDKLREVRVTLDTWSDPHLGIRTSEPGNGMTFSGYAAVFNRDSEPMFDFGRRGYVERIDPNAFNRTVKRGGQRMFLNHNTDALLATQKAGTLRLSVDATGLLVNADLPDTNLGRDTAELVRRGDITSMSFGFMVPDKASNGGPSQLRGAPGKLWEPTAGTEGFDQRLIIEANVLEASPVTGWPAYPDTTAAVRQLTKAGDLTEQQRTALRKLLEGRRRDVVPAEIAEWRARMAAKGIELPALRTSSAAIDAGSASECLAMLLELLGDETDDPAQAGYLQTAIEALQSFISSEAAEIGTAEDMDDSMMPAA